MALTEGEGHAELLGGSAAIDRLRLAGPCAAAAQHFTGIRVCGQAAGVDAVAVVLDDELTGCAVELDQDVAGRIEGDEAL